MVDSPGTARRHGARGGNPENRERPRVLRDRPHLDAAGPGPRYPGRHLDRLVQVSGLYDVVAAELLLGLGEGAVGDRDPALTHPDRGRGPGRQQPVAPEEMAALSDCFRELGVFLVMLLRVGLVHLLHHLLSANQTQKLHRVLLFRQPAAYFSATAFRFARPASKSLPLVAGPK